MALARALMLCAAGSIGALVLGISSAGAGSSTKATSDTTLISRSTSGGLPNGPSGHPVLSLDSRRTTLLAFDSTATDLVTRRTGGGSNVYFVRRAGRFGNNGTPWIPGPIQLASRGRGGRPANGPSTLPAVSGDNRHPPRCIAFVSAASNLVRGDTNRKRDAFAFFTNTGKTIRLSVSTQGRQANGAATAVAVNSRCTRFAFADDATNLAARTRAGVSQIYLRNVAGGRAVTTLVSARGGRPGNGDSVSPVFAAASNDVAFASVARNLGGSTGGFSQVYAAGPNFGALRMLSTTAGGRPGNGDSDQPNLTQHGMTYAFRTRARNLGSPGPAQIVSARKGGRLRRAGPRATADQAHPAVVNQGHYIVFQNGPEVGVWTDVRKLFVLLSRDSHGDPLTLPATNPSSSEALNYAAFETSDPFADHDFADTQPGWNADTQGTLQRAQGDPAYHQVYLRWHGAK